jgi:hypothetical protein
MLYWKKFCLALRRVWPGWRMGLRQRPRVWTLARAAFLASSWLNLGCGRGAFGVLLETMRGLRGMEPRDCFRMWSETWLRGGCAGSRGAAERPAERVLRVYWTEVAKLMKH